MTHDAEQSPESSPFAGLKVVAVTRVIAAPFAAYQLALHGADVITVEAPGEGDSYRYSGDQKTPLPQAGMGGGFLAQSANKRSLTLNFAEPEGQEILRRLVEKADVFIENLRTGTLARYGLDFASMSQINPRLVYCSVTGYGQTGPKRRDPAMDMAIQAASGMMSVTGTPESGPVKTSFPVVDYATGMSATIGILTALLHRTRTGRGQYVDVSMLETALVLMSSFVTDYVTGGTRHGLVGNGSGRGNYVHNAFRTANGVLLIAAGTELRRSRLWKVLGLEDIYQDPRFVTPELCRRNVKELDAVIEARLMDKPAAEWESLLQDAGVTAMYVRSIPEIVEHPQILARDFFHTFPDQGGRGFAITVPKASYKLSEGQVRMHSAPASVGQNTDEILVELGYKEQEIIRLHERGIV